MTPARLAALLALAALAVAAGVLVTPDWFPALHTFGMSAGTAAHYCSADLVRWHLAVSCETAR